MDGRPATNLLICKIPTKVTLSTKGPTMYFFGHFFGDLVPLALQGLPLIPFLIFNFLVTKDPWTLALK